jgi:hypothetical protein
MLRDERDRRLKISYRNDCRDRHRGHRVLRVSLGASTNQITFSAPSVSALFLWTVLYAPISLRSEDTELKC